MGTCGSTNPKGGLKKEDPEVKLKKEITASYNQQNQNKTVPKNEVAQNGSSHQKTITHTEASQPLLTHNENIELSKNGGRTTTELSTKFEEHFEVAPKHYIHEDSEVLLEKNAPLVDSNPELKIESEPDKSRKKGDQKKLKLAATIQIDDITENVTKIEKELNQQDILFIISCLKNHFVFYNLSESQLKYIVKNMFYCKTDAGQYVFEQGEEQATCFFIVENGEVQVEIDQKIVRSVGVKGSFGELALLYSAPRSASIKAVANTFFWGINASTFQKTLSELIEKQFKENRSFLDGINFFSSMTNEQKNSIAMTLSAQKFDTNQDVVREGDQASSYYIIKEGEVSCLKGETEVRKLSKGDAFGEQALYMNSFRALTVRAIKKTTVLALGREQLIQILGGKVQHIIYKNTQRWAFEKNPHLQKLTKLQTEKIIETAVYSNIRKDTVLFEAGQETSKLIIMMEGSATNTETGEIYQKGSIIGWENLISNNNITANQVIMKSDGVISTLSLVKVYKIIGGTFQEAVQKNENSHEKKLLNNDMTWKKDAENIALQDLIYVKELGRGQFGVVLLVKKLNNSRVYALKVVSKAKVVADNLQNHILAEKNVLEEINYPFIMSLFRTFKDEHNVYFMVEFVDGLELFDVIREIGYLDNYQSKFYVGSMILALEYLHYKNIIYRDLKPENIMIDILGYLKLVDLGTAKIIKSSTGIPRTNTLLGTPHYMAPEIFEKKGYSFQIDLWSVGVCLFEFMVGYLPYGDDCDDPFEIYNAIKQTELSFPKFFAKSEFKAVKSMIEQLLSKIPERRNGGSYAVLKSHLWFDDLDWDLLIERKLKAPFLPKGVVSEKLLLAANNENKLAINEIGKEENIKGKGLKYNPKANQNWDKEFQEIQNCAKKNLCVCMCEYEYRIIIKISHLH